MYLLISKQVLMFNTPDIYNFISNRYFKISNYVKVTLFQIILGTKIRLV